MRAGLPKCLSVMQPWATLLVHGAKRIETRSWATKHRAPLLIQAGKRFPPQCQDLCRLAVFANALDAIGITPDKLPLGAIIGCVDVIDCQSVDKLAPDAVETMFGDYRPYRYGWLCANHRQCEPVYCPGKLSLFDCPEHALAHITKVFPELAELGCVTEKARI